MGHRKMPAYGEREHGGRYILDEYEWSRNHCKAVTIYSKSIRGHICTKHEGRRSLII